jgi:hypothetical protein
MTSRTEALACLVGQLGELHAGTHLASQLGALSLAALALEHLHLETRRTGRRAATLVQQQAQLGALDLAVQQ